MSCIAPAGFSTFIDSKINVELKKKAISTFVQSFETGEKAFKQTDGRAISYYVPKLIEDPTFFCHETKQATFEKVLEWITQHANLFQIGKLFNHDALKARLTILKEKERDELFRKLIEANSSILKLLPSDFQEAHPDLQPKIIEQLSDNLPLPCNAGD